MFAWHGLSCPPKTYIHPSLDPSRIAPVASRRCPRLQLRGSAGFAPASLFLHRDWSVAVHERANA